MKLGFVDSIFNAYDVYAGVQEIAQARFANLQLSRATVPDVLKIPAASKKLFDSGCDAVLAFLTPAEEDKDALFLTFEKTIDVEVATGKYVFFCMVGKDEFTDDASFAKVADERIELALSLVNKTVNAPLELAKDIGSDAFAAFSQMSAAVTAGQETPAEPESGGLSVLPELGRESSGKTLF